MAGWTAVLGGLLVIALQVWELTDLPFFPGSSGYASCFIGWAALNIALMLSGIYWIETLLARQVRLQRALPRTGVRPSRPCRRPGCSGPAWRAAPTIGVSSRWSPPFSGYCSMYCRSREDI